MRSTDRSRPPRLLLTFACLWLAAIGCSRSASDHRTTSSAASVGQTAPRPAPSSPSSPHPVRVTLGQETECLILDDGRAQCSPYAPGGKPMSAMTAELGGPKEVVSVGLGRGFGCMLTRSGEVWGWGQGAIEFMGPGGPAQPSNPVHVNGLGDVAELAVGTQHACARKTDGSVWCWGVNTKYQLGSEQLVDSTVPVKVEGLGPADEIAAGPVGSCARLGKELQCWGDEKVLGKEQRKPAKLEALGEVATVAIGPLNICVAAPGGAVGCTAVEEGERLVTFPIEHVAGGKALAMGQGHGCALTESGEVWCWGATDELTEGGFSRAQATAVHVAGLSGASTLAAYGTTTCAVARDGGLWCWRWGRRKAGAELAAELVPAGASAKP